MSWPGSSGLNILLTATHLVILMLQTMKENADGVIFFFSMTDRSSFEDIPQQMSKILGDQSANLSKLVIATKYVRLLVS